MLPKGFPKRISRGREQETEIDKAVVVMGSIVLILVQKLEMSLVLFLFESIMILIQLSVKVYSLSLKDKVSGAIGMGWLW